LTVDYGLWNAVVSTATLVIIAATAFAALRQIQHLRAQTTLAGLLKVLDTWRDPEFQRLLNYVRNELPARVREPGFLDDLDGVFDRAKHPEVAILEWYEQIGSYMKYGLLDEQIMLDVSSSSCNTNWQLLAPVIERMRRTRGDALWENFEYMAARGVLYQRANAGGSYPRGTPRLSELGGPVAYAQALRDAQAGAAEAG
jgi:hypothetical protein